MLPYFGGFVKCYNKIKGDFMTLTVGTDSYCTQAEATAYFANTLKSAEWVALSSDDMDICLKMACRKMENEIYKGVKQSNSQALQFPRNYSDSNLNGTPQDVKDAQSELALYLYQNQSNQLATAQAMGLKSISLGNESYTISAGGSITGIMSITAQELLQKWLNYRAKIC